MSVSMAVYKLNYKKLSFIKYLKFIDFDIFL